MAASDVGHLREDRVLQHGVVAHEGVEGADAAHGRVQVLEQLVADAGGDLGAVAPGAGVLVRRRARVPVLRTLAAMASQS